MKAKVSHIVGIALVSPLAPDHSKKRNIFSQYETTIRNFNLYVGEYFCMKIPYSLNLTKLVENTTHGGFVTTDFFASFNLKTIRLTAGGLKLLSTPNAGGSSIISEVLSFEVLGRCFGAKLTRTEMEVSYFPMGGSITDYVCEMSDTTVGVSVTRAWKYMGQFDLDDATHLLRKKLKGVNQSSRNSLVKWHKQILHVWSSSDFVTDILRQAYTNLNAEFKSNTVVLVSTASRADFIFKNG